MQTISWTSVAFYCAFGIFVFYQLLHVRSFRGGSQGFLLVLTLSAFVGVLTGFAYLIYYGWTVVWWAPCVIFAIGLVASLLSIVAERVVGSFAAIVLSFAGFFGWPICAYFMFKYVPTIGA